MQAKAKISARRRTYNKLVANETMEDFALRFTAFRARKWSSSRIATTALGIVSFMVLEAIGGAITLNYGFINTAWAILALMAVIFITGAPISFYAARYGVDIDLLSRGAGFGYIGSTVTSLVYASFTLVFFALEAAIMAMAIELLLDIPLYISYAISALMVMPLVTHGMTYISRFQMLTQPIWIVLQLIPLLYVFNHPDSSLNDWMSFSGDAGDQGRDFDILLFGAASAVLLSLVAQIGEQVAVLRFLPPKSLASNPAKWWVAVILAGPGWIIFGAGKLFLGSFLAFFAIEQGVSRELASDPAHMYQSAFGYLFNNTTISIAIAATFVILSQLKFNVANAYAGSLAWSNVFSRITRNHPGRVVWMIFNILIALLLMELGLYQTVESVLQIYSVLVLSWLSSVAADLLINKSLGLSPPGIEFKRSKLYDINPVGTISMFVASAAGFSAHLGLMGTLMQAMSSYVAFFIPFICAPLVAWLTQGRFYLVDNQTNHPLVEHQYPCCICENTFDREDMSFCPAYTQPICSLCCTLDTRCGDKCRENATLTAQILQLFSRYLNLHTLRNLTPPILPTLALTTLLSGISAAILFLIYCQIPMSTPDLRAVFAATLSKIFFSLLIIVGVVSWLFTLVRLSNQAALSELRAQTKALAREVSAHEKTSLAYQLAKDEAESANKAKSRYLAGLSHELRTPLNVLLGYTQLLASDARLPDNARTSLQIMKRNGEHLGDLIESVLEVSKLEAGRLAVDREEIQLPQVIEQLVDMFESQAVSKELQFICTLETPLPDVVLGDKQRLRQILINLLSNAVKFTQTGSVSFLIRYRNEVAQFIVKDTGPGIAPKDQQTVFNPFERIQEPNSSIPGTGLGLTISRALAELMGGEIELISEIGKGCQFKLSLMLPRLRSSHRTPVLNDKLIYDYHGPRKTILSIDDEASQRQLVQDILRSVGFEVHTAASVEQGLQMLRKDTIDLLLLDLKMPNISGWQGAEMVRKEGYKLPIIIVSANVRDLDVENSAQKNHNDYLTKPFDIASLLNKVANWLDIEWKEHNNNDEAVPVTTMPNKPKAGRNQYQTLKSMAEIGYLSGFMTKLNDIDKNFHLPTHTQKELKQLASQIQFRKVIEKLDTLIKENGGT
ncbi:hybrid sensor histidine kinase/response regulator [Alteromonas sp. 14N.309.X.WAT.G.H12]|uniref:hybrid sensor histidine kinase/response regulator n=1 Tax=Alteromonas sp. 14N.309.X.WAT.G.H12 TaxID=3120824 RepID=UPI002FD062C5